VFRCVGFFCKENVMYQCDNILKTYADSGLRTVEDWTTLGRELDAGVKPCVDAAGRSGTVSLYSRGQTHARPRVAKTR
jgi:hypothetical protein